MSITFQFPTSWSLSERKNASLGNCNVRVNDAFIIFLLMASVFQSPNIPDGMSIDTMVAPDSFIIWITDTYPLDGSGDFSPVPKRPSITKSSGPSIGRSKFFMTSVNLDEYVGLDGSNDQSYRYFMTKHLFGEKPFKENFLPNGKATDLEAEAKHYDQIIEENPIDWQILGIGQNGHIGFNEPGTPAEITTHVVDLQESTIKANARFFESEADVPRKAISMGLASIMKSKNIVLMAYGKEKAEAIKGMVEGEVTTELPASILQNHANVTVIADEAAVSLLSK